MISNHDKLLHNWLDKVGYVTESDKIDIDEKDIDLLKCSQCKFGCKTTWGFYQCLYDGNPRVINMQCITRLTEGRK